MNNPDWSFYFKAFLVIALGGFVLVIASGFWHVLLVLILLAAVTWLWRVRRAFK